MKTTYITFAVLTLFASGCSSPTKINSRSDRAEDVPKREMPSRLETVNYDWEKYRIRVTFHRQTYGSSWQMEVRDAWSIYDQFTKEERAWLVSESRCSTGECLQIIDRALSLFHAEKPNVKLETLDLEIQVVRDLWAEILIGLNRRLSVLETEKGVSRADVPDEVDDELRRIANTTATSERIKTLLGRHGISVRGIYPSTVTFKDSLSGRKWSDIGKLPDVGILVPGTFEFDLGISSIEKKTVSVSQSLTR